MMITFDLVHSQSRSVGRLYRKRRLVTAGNASGIVDGAQRW